MAVEQSRTNAAPWAAAWAAVADPVRSQQLAEIDLAMRRIKRSQTRRSLARLAARRDDGCAPPDPALVGVADAVEEGPPVPGEEVTVGLVAERVGVDPTRASRLVTAAIEAGLVVRVASQSDGRRVGLQLTERGSEVLTAAHQFRQFNFALAMRDWSDADRAEFARLLTRFTDGFLDATGC